MQPSNARKATGPFTVVGLVIGVPLAAPATGWCSSPIDAIPAPAFPSANIAGKRRPGGLVPARARDAPRRCGIFRSGLNVPDAPRRAPPTATAHTPITIASRDERFADVPSRPQAG